MIMYQIINTKTNETRHVAAKSSDDAKKWCGDHEEVNGTYEFSFRKNRK